MFDDEEAISTQDYPAAEDPMSPSMQGGDNSGVPLPEGAIDTGDNSGGPAIPGPAMGASAAPQGAEPGLMDKSYGPLAVPAQAAKNGIKSIISYLMGADAMPPQAIDGAGATVDPEGRMKPSERNLLALQHARENGGDDAAWALMQSNRVSYNAQTAFAKTALEGTQQKPADLKAAIDAANKAQANVLDGNDVQFAPHQGGGAITATVTRPGGQPEQFVLSPQQFARWLDVGGDGQWDKVMSTGAAQTLHRIANEGPSRGSKSLGDMPPLNRSARPDASNGRPQAAAPAVDNRESAAYNPADQANTPKTNFGKTPSTLNLSGSDERSAPVPDQTNYGAELEARALRMFPSVSQEAERNQWMAAQEGQYDKLENNIGVAAEKGRNDREKARITAGGRVEQEQVRASGARDVATIKGQNYAIRDERKAKIEADKLNMRAQELFSRDRNSAQGRAVKLISSKMATLQPLTEEENKLAKQMGVQGMEAMDASRPNIQGQPQQQQAPQQRPQQPQQQRAQSPGKPPVAGAKFFNGSWYTRGPNGESVPVSQ